MAALDAVEALLGDARLEAWPSRDDDLRALRVARERLVRRFTLAVVGEFSSGKSYLLNALLGKVRYDDARRIAGLLATDINPSTATITELEYGAAESATARYGSGRTERIPLDSLSRFVAVGRNDAPGSLHDATADDGSAPEYVTVAVDSTFLRRGFTVADTPGLASLNPAHRRATLGYLPRTDAVLYLIDTQQPFTEGDASFLGLVGEHVRTIFIVQTKIDLWRMREHDGREAWEAARGRIIERARRFAPGAEVYSVSARDYAAGSLDGDAQLIARSGFPELFAGLERSLDVKAQSARTARTLSVLRELIARTSARVARAADLTERDAAWLLAERERAGVELAERERALARERDQVERAGLERRAWILAQGAALAADGVRALAAAIDVADIERVRDSGRFHGLADATVAPIWTLFASDVAGHVARALQRIAKERPDLRVADLAALRLGGEPGTGAWSRDLASGVTSTIVLGAIGGPTVNFIHGVALRFGAHPPGAYMKRELGADLQATLFPAFEADVETFVGELAEKIAGVYADVAAVIERERVAARAESLAPIDGALAVASEPAARERRREALGASAIRVRQSEALLAAADAAAAQRAPTDVGDSSHGRSTGGSEHAAFDADAYGRGLRPERYRVVVLGALRRGKSSLINAIAGTRLLQDEGDAEALFPIHVRYGERECAFALEREGVWNEIPAQTASAQAARSPVLIETPWSMPRQLVLVHAPPFDSGNEGAEEIALAAARNASEILGLFSRQLSDRELGLYARVADMRKPMLLAHTIADNESAAERRTVVELAARYVAERGLDVSRIFTTSALDFLDAAQNHRAAAPWNELGALRDTLQAHAEEHMRRLADRARRANEFTVAQAHAETGSQPKLRRALERFFGRNR